MEWSRSVLRQAAGFRARAAAIDFVPRHFGEQNRESAPAGRASEGEAAAEESGEKCEVFVHGHGKDRAGESEQSDDQLHLTHQGQDLALSALEGKALGFPCEDAAIEDGEIAATCGLQFLIGLLGAFAAVADEHALLGTVRGGLDGSGIELIERHQV